MCEISPQMFIICSSYIYRAINHDNHNVHNVVISCYTAALYHIGGNKSYDSMHSFNKPYVQLDTLSNS